jgi:hypothetical protein
VRNLTRQAQDLKKNTNTPGMGEMIKQASSQISDLNEQQQGAPDLIANGEAGKGIVKGMGTPARGAQWFNVDIDLEVHVGSRAPYRVTNDYLVPSWAGLGPGAELPLKVDREDPAKIAIDWDQIEKPAARGEIRPA